MRFIFVHRGVRNNQQLIRGDFGDLLSGCYKTVVFFKK